MGKLQTLDQVDKAFQRHDLTTETIVAITEQTAQFYDLAEALVQRASDSSRELSLALTHLEIAKFFANQALAVHGAAE